MAGTFPRGRHAAHKPGTVLQLCCEGRSAHKREEGEQGKDVDGAGLEETERRRRSESASWGRSTEQLQRKGLELQHRCIPSPSWGQRLDRPRRLRGGPGETSPLAPRSCGLPASLGSGPSPQHPSSRFCSRTSTDSPSRLPPRPPAYPGPAWKTRLLSSPEDL